MDVQETIHNLQRVTKSSAILLEAAAWTPCKVAVTLDAMAITVTFADGDVIEYQVVRLRNDWAIIHTNAQNEVATLYRTNNHVRIIATWARTLIREIG